MTRVSDDELCARALEVRQRAYAPYSNFRVGCAVSAGNAVFEGANVENATYGLAICAERNAISTAISAGATSLDTIAVATETSPPAMPCGMCRQTMAEFAADPDRLRILLVNPAGERRELTLAELFPHAFTRSQLDRE